MNTKQITEELQKSHLEFINFIDKLSKENYNFSFENKWNAGQHLDHITKSVAILTKAFSMPKWLIKYKFGKANRPSRSAKENIKRYLEKLKTAKPTPSRFQPDLIEFEQKKVAFQKLENTLNKLCVKATKLSEKKLDYYILPHPLLGKMTFRELLHFTTYHVTHHQKLIKNSLNANK